MPQRPWLLPVLLSCAWMGAGATSHEACEINTGIVPPKATADHSAAPPGNQAQFSLASTVQGNCPMIPDRAGVWSTSDQEDITVSDQGLATCLKATSSPAMINNSGTIRGHAYPSATLVCK